jgi:hypothetical protein
MLPFQTEQGKPVSSGLNFGLEAMSPVSQRRFRRFPKNRQLTPFASD